MRPVIIVVSAALCALSSDPAAACPPAQFGPFAEPPPPRSPEEIVCEYPISGARPHLAPKVPSRRPDPVEVGLGATLSRISRQDVAGEGVGGVLRLRRSSPVELELSLGRDRFDTGREELRLGAALIAGLSTSRLSPYLLIGGGAARIEERDGVAKRYLGYLEGGAGLSLRVTESLSIAADLRYSERRRFDQTEQPTPRSLAAPDLDEASATEARVSALLRF